MASGSAAMSVGGEDEGAKLTRGSSSPRGGAVGPGPELRLPRGFSSIRSPPSFRAGLGAFREGL